MFRPTRKRAPGGPRFGSTPTVITRNCLDSALACAESSYPNEFGGILRSEEPGVITELLLLPGTTSGARHANFQLYMLPADRGVMGTVHSHPSGALHPSDADLRLFRHWGRRHLIVGYPFSRGCWRAYDGTGEETHLSVRDGPTALTGAALPVYRPAVGRPPGTPEVRPLPDEVE
ncbi:MAG TPA: Mov34/MPN/PAD-1 family protein [Thermoplasmata archaeon]|nr:Mov34/MPN/PAD-1 family protein [Thermoplasmata archaeon]